MAKTMSIDFVRQVLEQTLEIEHIKSNSKYYGGKDQVNIFSFYEQLKEDDEVERYVETYRELVEQQNRSGLIMNGVVIAPETPQIMNLHIYDIVPFTFTCTFRIKASNRDNSIDTINNLIKVLKGRKRDIACFEDGSLLMVGTPANNVIGKPELNDGDFIGKLANSTDQFDNLDIDSCVSSCLAQYVTIFVNGNVIFNGNTYYCEYDGKMYKVDYDSTTEKWKIDEGFKHHAKAFTKHKVSLSFDTLKIDEPYNLNAHEEVIISFGGSATVVDENVELGNDLTKLGIKKSKIEAQSTINLTDSVHWLEPLEMPNSLGISSELTQLYSNNFIQNKHNDGVNPTFTYSFILDKKEPLILQLWKYARYGIQGKASDTTPYSSGVTPNTIYEIKEIWCSWGIAEQIEFNAKITESVDIENTESDVLTIKTTFEVQ